MHFCGGGIRRDVEDHVLYFSFISATCRSNVDCIIWASKRVVNVRKRNKTNSTYDSYQWYCIADEASASLDYTRSACPSGRPSAAGSSTWLVGGIYDGAVRRLRLDWRRRGCLATWRRGPAVRAEPGRQTD